MSQFNTGLKYKDGIGCEQSYERAVEWYEKAARQGLSEAQYSLGSLYYHGEGVTQSYERSVELFKQSAAQGDPYGQTWLGFCYANGEGVTKDYKEARRLFALAAKQGHPEAIEKLKILDAMISTECPLLGKCVVLTGTSREDLNGKAGVAISFDHARGWYVVEVAAVGKKCVKQHS